LPCYSTRLRHRDIRKYDDLKPVLEAEGRRPAPTKKAKGVQAGEDDFCEDEEYQKLGKMTQEYLMVIHDWAQTPIYHILMNNMDPLKAITKYCNKTTLNRLAGDLRERKEFEERAEMRARRQYLSNKMRNPFLERDSDSSGPEDKTQEKINEIRALRAMAREERIAQVIKHMLTETEVEYLIGTLRKNKTKRSIDDLSSIFVSAKHTFHVLMC